MDKKKTLRGGPNTAEGKRKSSQNSTNHGMCQERFILLPGESPEAYAALRDTWSKEYNLEHPGVAPLVEALVERDWVQQRCMRNVCRLEARLAEVEATQGQDVQPIEHLEKRLSNAYRYKTAAENSFARAIRILEKFRKARYDEDLKDGLFAVKRLEVIERALARRHKQGMDMDLHLEDFDEEENDSDADNDKPVVSHQTEETPR